MNGLISTEDLESQVEAETPNKPVKESDERDRIYNELIKQFKESDERDRIYSVLISRYKNETDERDKIYSELINKYKNEPNETDYDRLMNAHVDKYKAKTSNNLINEPVKINALYDTQTNKTQEETSNVISKKKIAGIEGFSMLTGAGLGVAIALLIAPFTFGGSLALLGAAVVIGAVIGGIIGSIAAYKEYQSSKTETPKIASVFNSNSTSTSNSPSLKDIAIPSPS